MEALVNRSGGEYWYVAPTYRQVKTIAWRMLVKLWWTLPEDLRGEKNESELWVDIGNSRISLKGADNEDSLRGSGLFGLILDEVASYKNWIRLWEESLSPALTDNRGFAWFIGTPKGYNHFYELWLLEQNEKYQDYKSFHFTSYDNPYLSKEEIEREKEQRTEDSFGQEYLAEFKKFTGIVYKEFSRDIHVINPFKIPVGWEKYRAMDFGFTNPTVCLWITVDRDRNLYVYDEYYQAGQTIEFHSNVIKAKTQSEPIISTWGDPSAEQEIMDFGNQFIYITPAVKVFRGEDNSWVLSGIDRIARLLKVSQKTGKPKLFIFGQCRHLIKEFELYRWIEKIDSERNEKDMPLKAYDHCLDALRYFVVSYFAGIDIADSLMV